MPKKYRHKTSCTISRGEFFSKWDHQFGEDKVVNYWYNNLKLRWKDLKNKKTFARNHPILHDVLMLEYLRRKIKSQRQKDKQKDFIINTIPQTYREVSQESRIDIDSIDLSFAGDYDRENEGKYDLTYDLLTDEGLRYKAIVEFKSNCNKGNKSDAVIEKGWNQLKDSIIAGKYKDIVTDGTVGIYFLVAKPYNISVETKESKKIYGYLPSHISGFKEDVRTIILPNRISFPELNTVYL